MSQNSQKSRKIRALAAGGAVLGLGAAITLASWSDSEFAQGLFNTDDFGIQAATDGESYEDHATEGEALELTFEGGASLYPGQTVAQAYQIRNIQDGADSVVTFERQTIGEGLDLTATVHQVEGLECTPETVGEELTLNGAFPLTGEEPQHLCVQVTLSGDHDQVAPLEAGVPISWQFEASHPEAADLT